MPDAHRNFAYATVSVAPVPATSGVSLTVSDGSVFPATPFNAIVCPAGVLPLASNAEIVRVTNRALNVLTIVRAQESSTARVIVAGDVIFCAVTAKMLTDAESGLPRDFGPGRFLVSAHGGVTINQDNGLENPVLINAPDDPSPLLTAPPALRVNAGPGRINGHLIDAYFNGAPTFEMRPQGGVSIWDVTDSGVSLEIANSLGDPIFIVSGDAGAIGARFERKSASGTVFVMLAPNGSDLLEMQAAVGYFAVKASGAPVHIVSGVPPDGDVPTAGFTFYLDATPGATKLKVKAKDSNGTVVTGTVNLA